MNNYTFNTSFF